MNSPLENLVADTKYYFKMFLLMLAIEANEKIRMQQLLSDKLSEK